MHIDLLFKKFQDEFGNWRMAPSSFLAKIVERARWCFGVMLFWASIQAVKLRGIVFKSPHSREILAWNLVVVGCMHLGPEVSILNAKQYKHMLKIHNTDLFIISWLIFLCKEARSNAGCKSIRVLQSFAKSDQIARFPCHILHQEPNSGQDTSAPLLELVAYEFAKSLHCRQKKNASIHLRL